MKKRPGTPANTQKKEAETKAGILRPPRRVREATSEVYAPAIAMSGTRNGDGLYLKGVLLPRSCN